MQRVCTKGPKSNKYEIKIAKCASAQREVKDRVRNKVVRHWISDDLIGEESTEYTQQEDEKG